MSMSNAEYARRYYEKNKDKMKARAREHTKAQRERIKTYIEEFKTGKLCADCGLGYPPRVMDFHHEGEKDGNIADMYARAVSLSRLQAEIDKCILLCANCHRMR
jgi:hypothetical protein